jgi:hypothetical protein
VKAEHLVENYWWWALKLVEMRWVQPKGHFLQSLVEQELHLEENSGQGPVQKKFSVEVSQRLS